MNYANKIILGDCIDQMKKFPSSMVDLIFADPPYNLEKDYGLYQDSNSPKDYIKWTETWLNEIIRILKPNGSFYILNLPKWSLHHAVYLDELLYRQNTITWDALATPRGKIMPAHYSLLFYTKSKTNYTFNELTSKHNWTHCARATCIKQRHSSTLPEKSYSDIWNNVYRVKHKQKRQFNHPTQLPLQFMERIILTSSNKGDLIMDPFIGVGTTAIAAKMLERDYLGIEINPEYVKLCKETLSQKHFTNNERFFIHQKFQ